MVDPLLTAAAKGVATAAGRETAGQAKQAAVRYLDSILNGKLGAIGSPQTVQQLRQNARLPESEDWREFIGSREQLDMVCAGIYLRAIAEDQDLVHHMREAIIQEYGPLHLRLAEAVQAELIDPILAGIKRYCRTTSEYNNRAVTVFQDIDRYVLLVKTKDLIDPLVAKVRWRLQQECPPVFIVAGSGAVVETTTTIANAVQDGTLHYDKTTTMETNRVYHLLRRVRPR